MFLTNTNVRIADIVGSQVPIEGQEIQTMTIATQKMTLAEFLAFDDGTETRYELENGEINRDACGK